MLKTIACIYGGPSLEHDVSLQSMIGFLKHVDMEKFKVIPFYIEKSGTWKKGNGFFSSVKDSSLLRKLHLSFRTLRMSEVVHELTQVDCVFPILHGMGGEDGSLQGMLETIGVPYVGSDVAASALCMHKRMMKNLFAAAQIAQTPFLSFTRDAYIDHPHVVRSDIEHLIGVPLYVKPARQGSSIGIRKINDLQEIDSALWHAFSFDDEVVVERAVQGREIEVGVISTGSQIWASVPGEIVYESEFYDYQSKYQDQSTQLQIPATLSAQTQTRLQDIAKQAFLQCGCSGLARVDFFVTNNRENKNELNEEIKINEINTMPGLTDTSMFPKLWEASGISTPILIEMLVDAGIERFERKKLSLS